MTYKKSYSVKEEIQKALQRLISEKSPMDITVTELIAEAKVARVSFYRHFSSISDVLDSIVGEIEQAFSAEIVPPINSKDKQKWRSFLTIYFYQITQRPKEFLAIDISRNSPVILRAQNKITSVLGNKERPSRKDIYDWVGRLSFLHGIARLWVETGMQESTEEMVNYTMAVFDWGFIE